MYEEISQLYNALYDGKSKRNFIYRMAFNLSGNWNYLVDLIDENIKGGSPNIADFCRGRLDKKRLIIYGAANSGKVRYDFFQYLNMTDQIECFCDKDIVKQMEGLNGKKVISPEELIQKYKDCYVLIETKYYYDEVYEYLTAHQFPKENIIRRSNFGMQYFDYEYMPFSDDEVMVDAGCLNCGTFKKFINKVNGSYSKIIALEPDKINYDQCVDIIKNEEIRDVQLINAGIWMENTVLAFEGGRGGSSKIVSDQQITEENKIKVVRLDTICKDQRVSFIKMDIEGAELSALMGAKETIKKYRPKLAICVYHKDEDITDIQEYLMSLVPEYRFGIRHYMDYLFETVLYAFCPD